MAIRTEVLGIALKYLKAGGFSMHKENTKDEIDAMAFCFDEGLFYNRDASIEAIQREIEKRITK